jgi:hypothetical protein
MVETVARSSRRTPIEPMNSAAVSKAMEAQESFFVHSCYSRRNLDSHSLVLVDHRR